MNTLQKTQENFRKSSSTPSKILEIFKQIPNTNFEVSNLGTIKNSKTQILRKIGWSANDDPQITLTDLSIHKLRLYYVKKLVAQAFVKNPNGYLYVFHKNGNRNENTDTNLEWCEEPQNQIPTKSNSGHRGIYLTKHGTYQVTVQNKCIKQTKTFKTETEALQYQKEQKQRKIQGMFSSFPPLNSETETELNQKEQQKKSMQIKKLELEERRLKIQEEKMKAMAQKESDYMEQKNEKEQQRKQLEQEKEQKRKQLEQQKEEKRKQLEQQKLKEKKQLEQEKLKEKKQRQLEREHREKKKIIEKQIEVQKKTKSNGKVDTSNIEFTKGISGTWLQVTSFGNVKNLQLQTMKLSTPFPSPDSYVIDPKTKTKIYVCQYFNTLFPLCTLWKFDEIAPITTTITTTPKIEEIEEEEIQEKQTDEEKEADYPPYDSDEEMEKFMSKPKLKIETTNEEKEEIQSEDELETDYNPRQYSAFDDPNFSFKNFGNPTLTY